MSKDDGMGSIITLGVIGAAAYFAYEWLKSTGCAVGGTFYGDSFCSSLFGGSSVAAAAAQPTLAATLGAPAQTGNGQFMVPFTITGPPNTNVTAAGGSFSSLTVIGTLNSSGTLVGSFGLLNPYVTTITLTAGATSTTVNLPPAPSTLPVIASSVPVPVLISPSMPSSAPAASSIASQMQAEAVSNAFIAAQGGQADAYQWAQLWQDAGQPQVNNVNGIFYPNGLNQGTPNGPGLSSQGLPLISLTGFLSTLQSSGYNTGVSGLGFVNRIPVGFIHRRYR